MHSASAAELCLADSIRDEADALVEGESVFVRSHLNARYPFLSGVGKGVEHEFRGNAAPHPIGVDEEVIKLTDLSDCEHCCEADDSVIDDSDADAAVRDGTIGVLECVGMGEQASAIAFVRERRSSLHIAECGQGFHRCEAEPQVRRL